MVNSSAGSGAASANRIWFGGFASGLDTQVIVDALTAAAARPMMVQQQRAQTLTQKKAAFDTVNSSVSSLLSTLATLKDPKITGARVVTTTGQTVDINKVSATATNAAALGSFKVDVLAVATGTRTASTSAVGKAVDASVALDSAGFDTPFTYGTFSINGTKFTANANTATSVISSSALGASIDATVKLSSAGFTTAPSGSGSFSINGTAIAYDASVDSLNTMISRINASAANVTASYDATTRTITIKNNTTGPGAITLSDTSGNFLAATNVLAAAQTSGTVASTLTGMMNAINASGTGVTASLVNDASGRPNLLQLTSASPISLGAGDDTSNFLTATHLAESTAGTTRTSTRPLGVTNTGLSLQNARLTTAPAASGSFTINGVSFTYDSTSDSIGNLLTRINGSAAGVTATFDTTTDRLQLTSNTTGGSSIALADVSGNFLAATKVLAATQSLGTPASYQIDGGAVRTAVSNTITDALPGITLTLKDVTTQSLTVQVAADMSGVTKGIQDFVNQYNQTMKMIDQATYIDAANKGAKNGVLVGDSALSRLQQQLKSQIAADVPGLDVTMNSLEDLGLNFGAVGSKPGSTTTLLFDTAKFTTAMQNNPEQVRKLLSGFQASGSLTDGGTILASVSGRPSIVGDSGTYGFTLVGTSLTSVFTPDNGDPPVTTVRTITAGSSDTTLIPGMTLNFKGVLANGTATIKISADYEGAAKSMYESLNTYARSGGILDGRSTSLQSQIDDINAQVTKMQDRVNATRDRLVQRYAALEVTMAKLQQQQQALGNFQAKAMGTAKQQS